MDTYKNKLMSKNGKITLLFAREMLSAYIGYRIKTIGEYAERYGVGRGTVQSAIKFLQANDAIELEAKGHLGTYITKIDYKKLWEISDVGSVMGVMPLPYSKRYEGLATGLYKNFTKADISFSLAFMRGANKRIEALTQGKYNFAIVSKLAFYEAKKTNDKIEMLYEFGPKSYVCNHSVIFKEKNVCEISDGMRIAYDPFSIDQVILTNCECEGKKIKYVETSYNQILQKLENNEIDAAVWNGDEIVEKNLDFNVQPLKKEKSLELDKQQNIAVIVTHKENMFFAKVMTNFIDLKEVEDIQKKIILNEILPIY